MIKRNFEADQRICAAATVGKWYVFGGKYGEEYLVYSNVNGIKIADGIYANKPGDAHFIAEARTGWPAALAEIERLKTELIRIMQVSKWDGVSHELDRCYVIAKEALRYDGEKAASTTQESGN